MNPQPGSNKALVISYHGLRTAAGIVGIALPFLLAFGKIILDTPGIESSISAYYYTVMRNVLVGGLCAIAVFLLTCSGYDRRDTALGVLACIFGVLVAIFPVAPEVNATSRQLIIGRVHLTSAVCFFLTLAYFSLVLFRKTDPNKTPTRRKLQRNFIYMVCGLTILACLALIAVVELMPKDSPIRRLDPVFWLEATAIFAFGVSWFTKGETILKG